MEWDQSRNWPPVSKNSREYREARRVSLDKLAKYGRVAIEREADDRLHERMKREMPELMEEKAEEIAQVAEAEREDSTKRPAYVTPEERTAWEGEVFHDGEGIAGVPVEIPAEIPQWAIPSRNDKLNLTFYVNKLLSHGRVVPELQWLDKEPSFRLSGTGFFAAIAVATVTAVTAGQAPSTRFLICSGRQSRFVKPGNYGYCEDCGTSRARWRRAQRKRRERQHQEA
jgi:hypothetical protein